MEGRLDESSCGVDEGLASAFDGAEHDIGSDAAVEVGLAVDMVAEVVAFGSVFPHVAERPGTGDDGLDAEDVCLVAVDFALDDAGDIGLEIDIVEEEHVTILEERYFEVAFVGALLAVLWVEAEDAGGVGGFETDGSESTIVGLVDADVNLFPFRSKDDGEAFANHVFDEFVGPVAGGVEIIVAEVDRDVDTFDGVGGVEAHLHVLTMGISGGE